MNVKAMVFDLYGTLLDVVSVEGRCASVVPNAKAFVELWRQKQLEYTWLRTVVDRYEDFEAVTTAALDYAIARGGTSMSPHAHERLLNASGPSGSERKAHALPCARLSSVSPSPISSACGADCCCEDYTHDDHHQSDPESCNDHST